MVPGIKMSLAVNKAITIDLIPSFQSCSPFIYPCHPLTLRSKMTSIIFLHIPERFLGFIHIDIVNLTKKIVLLECKISKKNICADVIILKQIRLLSNMATLFSQLHSDYPTREVDNHHFQNSLPRLESILT